MLPISSHFATSDDIRSMFLLAAPMSSPKNAPMLSLKILTEVSPADKIMILSAGDTSVKIFNDSIGAFFGEDIGAANKNIERISSLVAKCEEIGNIALKQKGKKALSIGYISESIRRVGEYSGDLAEYVINYLV